MAASGQDPLGKRAPSDHTSHSDHGDDLDDDDAPDEDDDADDVTQCPIRVSNHTCKIGTDSSPRPRLTWKESRRM